MTQTTTKPHHTGHRARLRERFLKSGANALADYELLELILFPAKPVGDVKPLAKQLIKYFGSFSRVMHAEPEQLKEAGANEAAVVAIRVVTAASSLMLKEEVSSQTVIKKWTALLDYCRVNLGQKKHEEFHVLFLNHKYVLLADELQQKGTIDHAPVYPREVVKRALELGASGVIMVHNHPSGDVNPSKADIDITRQVQAALKPLNIALYDHVIVGKNAHYSFKSYGVI